MSTAAKEMTDRELDALVAERVMGWEHRNGHWWQTKGGHASNTVTFAEVPRYSTDIAAAMLVVEKMRERFGVGTTTFMLQHYNGEQVMVEMNVPSSECQEWGRTAAEAICKCAIKALDKFNLAAALETVKG